MLKKSEITGTRSEGECLSTRAERERFGLERGTERAKEAKEENPRKMEL